MKHSSFWLSLTILVLMLLALLSAMTLPLPANIIAPIIFALMIGFVIKFYVDKIIK